ncbi:hypothetical protein SBA1_870008 [Candidatus Sulfotelmatobacter kueseliae]|uniref:Uncharacterized protein n=1 Tax=Candidatus Sulfotelmatobacter kueseliae TaxID=2042962 RepID=A0A2U3LA01_9BACT|nr:hypothetical protein SBA1_870008 [Candidatus Sulfotelmatobacter kueseliae]
MEYPEVVVAYSLSRYSSGTSSSGTSCVTDFLLVCVPSALDASDDVGLERISLPDELVHALRICGFEVGQAL